ncbi:MAG: flavodoxin domain-containing protein [Pseudomonadota bacterium]|uniref:Flavodoxin domain-containing protein n=1 Tax=Candidatus Desulfatibia profunda TaxID=2841695 RepID=A0A8J6TKV2_9BACT|nr:flavodoxin domain-containing protein [Candidatus Desulfatibia profunda]MBL7179216.1 flavodoxin domain-containing protein [Desulfobacterales bacterium]
MKPVEIAKGIYDVGVNDWNIRDFHGYSTYDGTSYNAFLIIDEKITLIDTVKKDFVDQLLENIAQIVDPKTIDFVISNHTEMDHSGGLARVMHKIGEDKPLYCSKMGLKNLSRHFPQKWNYHAVENGTELSLGKRTLTFLEARMLHWPDSMFTYLKEDKILFSSDAFGQHYAGQENFDDEIGDAIMPHAKKYFANILLPFSALILKLVEKVTELGLEFNVICPDHGIVWRRDPAKIINAYVKWSHQEPEKKAVVVYDTMWKSTEKMAEAIASGLHHEGIRVRPMHLRKWHRSDIMTEVMDARAVVIGSPTLNNGLFPTLGDFLTYMKGLKPQNKIGAAFGSYGWSGEAVKLINAELEAMKFDIIDPGVKIQYVPDKEGVDACYEFGKKIGKAVKR